MNLILGGIKMWELMFVRLNSLGLTDLLNAGWEPFGVTTTPDGDPLKGYIWLKKWKEDKSQGEGG